MKNLLFAFSLVFYISFLHAQDTETNERPSTFAISLSMENAFGFYPAIYGSFGMNEKADFTYYGLFWTNPNFAGAQTTFSTDIWLESGVGIGFDAINGTAYINPSLGFTHGKFLSGGDQSILFDGVVPSVIAYFYPGRFDGEVYLGFYKHFRDMSSGTNTYDFLFYYTYPGVWVNDKLSIGIHYEGLYLNYAKSELVNSYQWLGLYIKFYAAQKYSFRLSGGPNLKKGVYSDEFYKLSAYIPLL